MTSGKNVLRRRPPKRYEVAEITDSHSLTLSLADPVPSILEPARKEGRDPTAFPSRRTSLKPLTRHASTTVITARICAVIVFIVSSALYITTCAPSIAGGRSGALIVAAAGLGTLPSPGYPLYTLLAVVTSRLPITPYPLMVNDSDWDEHGVGIGGALHSAVAWRVNMLSSLIGGAAVSVVFLAGFWLCIYSISDRGEIIHCSIIAIINMTISLLFASSNFVWSQAVVADVHSLTNLVVAILFFYLIKLTVISDSWKLKCVPEEEKQVEAHSIYAKNPIKALLSPPYSSLPFPVLMGAFACGLCLCNDHSVLVFVLIWFIIAVIVVVPEVDPHTLDSSQNYHRPTGKWYQRWLLYVLRSFPLCLRPIQTLKLVFCFVIGLLPYAYIPIVQSRFHLSGEWNTIAARLSLQSGDSFTFSGFWILATDWLRQLLCNFSFSKLNNRLVLNSLLDIFKDIRTDMSSMALFLVVFPLAIALDSLLSRKKTEVILKVSALELSRHHRMQSLAIVIIALAISPLIYITVMVSVTSMPSPHAILTPRIIQVAIVPVYILLGLGTSACLELILSFLVNKTQKWRYRCIVIIVTILAIALVSQTVSHRYDRNDHRENTAFRNLGRWLLSPLPERSLLLIRGSHRSHSVLFSQAVEGFRRDVVVVETDLLRQKWYLHHLRVSLEKSGLKMSGSHLGSPLDGGFSMAAFLARNCPELPSTPGVLTPNLSFSGGVYTVGGLETSDKDDNSWKQLFILIPFGLSEHLVPRVERTTSNSAENANEMGAVLSVIAGGVVTWFDQSRTNLPQESQVWRVMMTVRRKLGLPPLSPPPSRCLIDVYSVKDSNSDSLHSSHAGMLKFRHSESTASSTPSSNIRKLDTHWIPFYMEEQAILVDYFSMVSRLGQLSLTTGLHFYSQGQTRQAIEAFGRSSWAFADALIRFDVMGALLSHDVESLRMLAASDQGMIKARWPLSQAKVSPEPNSGLARTFYQTRIIATLETFLVLTEAGRLTSGGMLDHESRVKLSMTLDMFKNIDE